MSAESLGWIGDVRAVQPLIRVLNDRERTYVHWTDAEMHEVRQAAVVALGKIGDVSAIHPLSLTLTDDDLSLRTDAAEALGGIGRREALPALKSRLRPIVGEHDPDVRFSLRAAIEKIESATIKSARLPRAAVPVVPIPAGRPRADD
jgi:HEAT repeat protein